MLFYVVIEQINVENCGFHSLLQGQKLLVKVDDSGRGPQVQAVRLLNE